MWVGGYVCMYVWYLKISRDPDDAEQWEWYQIEAEHMRRCLGTIRKFLRRLGGAWHVKTSPIGNALRKPDLVGYSCVFCEGASPSPFQDMTMCRACLQRAVQELHIPGGYISVAHLGRARAGRERKLVESGAPIENTCKMGKHREKYAVIFYPNYGVWSGRFLGNQASYRLPVGTTRLLTVLPITSATVFGAHVQRVARGAW